MRWCSFPAVSRALSHAWPMSRSEQLRQLAAQLASLATLEDAVARGVQALLEVPQESVAALPAVGPASRTALLRRRSRSRSPVSKTAPNFPRGSFLVSQRDPTGSSVKSCPAASPDRSV